MWALWNIYYHHRLGFTTDGNRVWKHKLETLSIRNIKMDWKQNKHIGNIQLRFDLKNVVGNRFANPLVETTKVSDLVV